MVVRLDNTHLLVAASRGGALGYTWYANMFSYGDHPECMNWVHIYEKTLPGLGGRSVVDGGLSDSGAVLAHEVGHQLVSSSKDTSSMYLACVLVLLV